MCEAGVEQEDKESKGRAPDEHPMEEGGRQVNGSRTEGRGKQGKR